MLFRAKPKQRPLLRFGSHLQCVANLGYRTHLRNANAKKTTGVTDCPTAITEKLCIFRIESLTDSSKEGVVVAHQMPHETSMSVGSAG